MSTSTSECTCNLACFMCRLETMPSDHHQGMVSNWFRKKVGTLYEPVGVVIVGLNYFLLWNCHTLLNEHVLVEMLKKLNLSCALYHTARLGESSKSQGSCCANTVFTSLKWKSKKLIKFKDTSLINFKGNQFVKSFCAQLTTLRECCYKYTRCN